MWSLWKFILSRLAKAKGFLDPMVVFSSLQHFSKPSEVWVPVELLRSGAVLQARGLINSQAIQNNLDWVWPFWVERQFNPNDKSFIPRAFSLTHINLTHRNWTAVGVPDFSNFPIVDPCGLVTPFFDGWSLDAWIINERNSFIPSRLDHVQQNLDINDTFAVLTTSQSEKFFLISRTEVQKGAVPLCTISFKAWASHESWLMICIRPYNPEGVSFINHIEKSKQAEGWIVNKNEDVRLDKKPFQYIFANYASGDLCHKAGVPDAKYLDEGQGPESISCPIGMATSAALYLLKSGEENRVMVKIPLSRMRPAITSRWIDHEQGACTIKVPDQKLQFLYNAAIKTMVLHSPGDIYPGPFTYKRFWFRDAAFILQAMMAVGLYKNIENIINRFPKRQTPSGYFKSQDGEWDSNGQAIWTIKRFLDTTNGHIKKEWFESVCQGAQWIERKRRSSKTDILHAGLLPAGFSAEHLGPSDYYYWDDFWSVAGLRDASLLAGTQGHQLAEDFQRDANGLLNAIEDSLASLQGRLHHPGMPASPSRRMDAGAIGCLVASYPLQIYAAKDERMLQTVKFLMDKYFLQGAFYHEISHSGINIYLTLHIAQVLLRAGDPRFFDIVKSVAALATPTGQWPEAIHPRTKGGCMGDGQHVWASAEWVMMLRNMFVREEQVDHLLILCSGIPQEWIKSREPLFLGPTQTLYGEISVTIELQEDIEISWKGQWHGPAPRIEIRLPGYEPYIVEGNVTSVRLEMMEAVK
jgi:hypothetical protein